MSVDVAAYRRQLDEAIDEMYQLFSLRYVWKNLLAMLSSPSPPPANALVNGWLSVCYTRTLAIGIRRQAEAKDTRPTIGSVLRRTLAHAQDFTAKSCGFEERGQAQYWVQYGAPAGCANEARLQELQGNIKAQGAVAVRWANKRIAHLDTQPAQATFSDLEAGLAALREAAVFLYGLFNGSQLLYLTPIYDTGWTTAFSVPWYDPQRVRLIPPETLG